MNKPDIRSLTEEELIDFCQARGWPAFRGKQLFRQAQAGAAPDFASMSNLPLAIREELSHIARLSSPRCLSQRISTNRDTAKLLLEWEDGQQVEMALMLYRRSASRDRATCCVSSQSGCAMGCIFCATGLFTSFRNLTAGEIVAQVQAGDALSRKLGFPGVSNVVYMGMGEPLANLHEVRRSIQLLNHDQGLNIGARRITISTCGLVPAIYELAEWDRQIGLAVSLHAAEDSLRKELMPAASRWPVAELMAACRAFQQRTGRRVTCEYVLIDQVNDSDEAAAKLGLLLTGTHFLVNIIPANPLPERQVAPSPPQRVVAFCRRLESFGLEVQVRESRGRHIHAACGQLRKGSPNLLKSDELDKG